MRTGKPSAEALLTRSVRQLLNAAGIFHWKNFGGPMGVKGVPDILGCYRGRLFGIELKAPKGKTSPDQEEFIKRINEAGGLAFCARTLDEVIEGMGLQERFLIR
jgi:hypothetical protein